LAEVDALVRYERAHDQIVVVGRLGDLEALYVDGRIEHVRLTVVGAADSIGDVPRDRDEPMDAGGPSVPAPERHRQRGPEHSPGQPLVAPEVVAREVPDIPHRRKAIAQMKRARGYTHAFGDAVAHRQDEVVAREIEPADRGRKRRQVVAVPRGRPRQALDERRDDAAALDRGCDGAGNVQEREERRVGKELAEDFEAALAASHSGQPVVDQGDSSARQQACSR